MPYRDTRKALGQIWSGGIGNNNLYIIGKKASVILEFVSFLTKQKFNQNLKKFKYIF